MYLTALDSASMLTQTYKENITHFIQATNKASGVRIKTYIYTNSKRSMYLDMLTSKREQ